ncbi:MAG: zf-HC2 domain-containing protein [Pseudomonadota bacterium]|nr:zf-HC2 domain-containing protein [Pseudomonadota bacterium]
MLSCHEATQLLSQRQDRPLHISENLALTLHTSMCSSCRQFGRQMQALRRLSQQYTQRIDPPNTPKITLDAASEDTDLGSDQPPPQS